MTSPAGIEAERMPAVVDWAIVRHHWLDRADCTVVSADDELGGVSVPDAVAWILDDAIRGEHCTVEDALAMLARFVVKHGVTTKRVDRLISEARKAPDE